MWLARALFSIRQHFLVTCVSLIGFGVRVGKVSNQFLGVLVSFSRGLVY